MIREMVAKRSIVVPMAAAVRLKRRVPRRRPPARAARPNTRSMFPIIDPVIEALTRSCNPARNATIAMINSAAFPKVALRSPPTPSPTWDANCSVARPIHPAKGMMATADAMNTTIPLAWIAKSSTKASGTKASMRSRMWSAVRTRFTGTSGGRVASNFLNFRLDR